MLYKTGNKYSIRLFNLSGKNIRCMHIYIQNNINTFGKHIIYSILYNLFIYNFFLIYSIPKFIYNIIYSIYNRIYYNLFYLFYS